MADRNRALVFERHGRPREVLTLREGPIPTPAAHEVRVRLTHRTINPADLLDVRGRYGTEITLPAVAGHEGAGIIDAVGSKVQDLKAGQRVVLTSGEATWQDYVVVPAAHVWPIPDALKMEDAAQLFVNGLTAHLLLSETLRAQPDDWILQTGASTAVGRTIIQLAAVQGIRTINIVRRESAISFLEQVGADIVLVADSDSNDFKEMAGRIRELSEGGVSGACDCVGGTLGGFATQCLRAGATLAVYGGLSGEPLSISPSLLIFNRISVTGFWRTAWARNASPTNITAALSGLSDVVQQGALHFPVDARYDLGDFQTALNHHEQRGRSGKILLTS